MDLTSLRLTDRGDFIEVVVSGESVGGLNVSTYRATPEFLSQVQDSLGKFLSEETQLETGPEASILPGLADAPLVEPTRYRKPTVERRYRAITSTGRIAIVFFPIVEPGGINTYVSNLQRAWRRAGHEVDLYYATPKGRMRRISEDEPTLVGKWYRLPGKQISYGTADKRKHSKRILNGYDLILFAHQCPHPDIRGNGEKEWMDLYDLKRPVFSVWHDNIWNRAYPWFEEVKNLVDVNLCTNPRIVADSGASFPGYFVYTPHPLDVSNAGLYRSSKRDRVVWLPQWKAWKGIKQFGEAVQHIDYSVQLYNVGIEYYQLRKKVQWWYESFGRDLWEPHAYKKPLRGRENHVIHGPIPYGEVPKVLQHARVSVDLTGIVGHHSQGCYSYVMVESMLYGAVPFVWHTTIQEPSPVPFYCVVTTDSKDPEAIAQQINELMADQQRQEQVAENAVAWATANFDENKIAAGILELVGKKFKHRYKVGALPGLQPEQKDAIL